jgi:poly(3-hydroxybutyrate) depolymerase
MSRAANETPIEKAGRIAARIATIVLALAAVAVKSSVDKALAELREAGRTDPQSPWR